MHIKLRPDIPSELGNFSIEYDKSKLELLDSYVDFASGLLILTFSDKENTVRTGGTVIHDVFYTVIDANVPCILTASEWTKRFDYSEKTETTADGRFFLKTKRVHNPETQKDSVHEELYEAESGKLISSSQSVAFRKERHETLYENILRREAEKAKMREKEESKQSLEIFDGEQKANVLPSDTVFAFSDGNTIWKVVFRNGKFVLLKKTENDISFVEQSTFDAFTHFWAYFTNKKDWFSVFTFRPDLLSRGRKYFATANVITSLREVKKSDYFEEISDADLYKWESALGSENIKSEELKQFCAHCRDEVQYFPRYPRYICKACMDLLTDESGRKVAFFNEDFSGGCQGYYMEDGKAGEKYPDCTAFIGNEKFIASEARFGGIVVQKIKAER